MQLEILDKFLTLNMDSSEKTGEVQVKCGVLIIVN